MWFYKLFSLLWHLSTKGFEYFSLECILPTNKECDIFRLSETSLTPAHPNNEFSFPGYKLSRKDGSNGINHGGVAIYVDEKLKFRCRDDLYSPDDGTIIIDVVYKRFSSFLLSVTYRAPNNDNEWMLRFDIMLNKLLSENKEIIITGDFNFDTLSNASLSKIGLS